jgi:hypothetical protein
MRGPAGTKSTVTRAVGVLDGGRVTRQKDRFRTADPRATAPGSVTPRPTTPSGDRELTRENLLRFSNRHWPGTGRLRGHFGTEPASDGRAKHRVLPGCPGLEERRHFVNRAPGARQRVPGVTESDHMWPGSAGHRTPGPQLPRAAQTVLCRAGCGPGSARPGTTPPVAPS